VNPGPVTDHQSLSQKIPHIAASALKVLDILLLAAVISLEFAAPVVVVVMSG
jgi:hypothetical protein